MHRKLALVGAIIGAVGLAGPASADPAGITSHQLVVIDEVGVNLSQGNISGTFIQLLNHGTVAVDISGLVVFGCDATNAIQQIAEIPSGTPMLDPGETFLIADTDFAGTGDPPNLTFDANAPDLVQSDGGLLLWSSTGFAEQAVKWAAPADTTCASFEAAGVTPDDSHTMKYDPSLHTWFLDEATL